jgi:hypothetical protein
MKNFVFRSGNWKIIIYRPNLDDSIFLTPWNNLSRRHYSNKKDCITQQLTQAALGRARLQLQVRADILQGCLVSESAETTDDCRRLVLEVAVVSEGLSRVNVGHMQLDKGNVNSQQRIANHDRGMSEAPGVDDDGIHAFGTSLLYTVDNGALMVGLEISKLDVQAFRPGVGETEDILQGRAAVEMRLAGSKKVEVRPVDDEDIAAHSDAGDDESSVAL